MGKNAPIPDRKVLSRPPVYTLLSLLLELEQMQVLWRLGQERRWFSEQQLLFSSRKLDEAGRMANGWRGQLASGVQLRRSGMFIAPRATRSAKLRRQRHVFASARAVGAKISIPLHAAPGH